MKKRLTHDFETQSESDLRKQGAYKYSLHPSTKPTCLAAKFHGQDAMMFLDTEEINRHWAKVPAGFRYHWNRAIEQEYEFSAHNSYFEKCIYDNILVKRYGWPPIPSKLRRCTAAKAAACALPRNLDGAGEAMRLHTQKDKAGYNAMMMSCKPTRQHNAWVKARREISEGKKVGKKKQTIAAEPEPQKFITPQSHPEVFRTLYTYCKIDVKSEEELDDSLPDLIPQEQEIWHFNQMLNWRGLRFDRPLVEKIVAIMATESEKKTTELDNLTMGLVQTGGAVKSILEFLEMEGVELPNLRKKTVEDALKEFDLADNTRQLLELRKALSMTSTKKYQSFLNRAVDDRVRDILMYHGASTGRDTGTGIMPHNFPRGLISKWAAEHAIDILENHDWDVAKEILNFYFGDSLGVVFSALLRNMIIPDDGHELYVADFSKIEVAVLWWLADNKDGLDVLRSGKDPYKFMAARNTGKKYEDIKDDSDDRQLGKAQILGSGFGMGWRKFQQTAWDLYRLKLSDEQSKAAIDTYRIVNKSVKDLWGAYERAAVQVVENGPGAVTYANYCRFMMSKRGFLFIALPSGRKLAYRDPQISWRETEWGPRKTLEFMGLDKSKKKLALERTWGGTLTENIVQAVARDLMMPAMVRLEKQGYKGMLSVHDEGLTMRKIGLGNVPEFVKIMTELPPWAKGLPLEAKGWCGGRYRK